MITHFEKLILFTIYLGLLLIPILPSYELPAQIPTESLDYWIGCISPRCAINIIYYTLTNDFIFNSTYDIPVMFVPLTYFHRWYSRLSYYLQNHKFYSSSLRFPRAECFFSVIYYKFPQRSKFIGTSTENDRYILDKWMYHIAYGFPLYDYYSFTTYTTFCITRSTFYVDFW